MRQLYAMISLCVIFVTAARPALAQEEAVPPPALPAADAAATPESEATVSAEAATTPVAAPAYEVPAAPMTAPADAPPAAAEIAQPEPSPAAAAATEPAPTGTTGICGTVIEASAKEPLIEAQVQVVKGGAASVRTDVDGRFVLSLPPGTYDLRVNYELHRSRRIAGVQVHEGKCTAVSFPLVADADAMEEVVVEARADARREAAVLAERRKAAPVSDAVSAQEISRTPDSSASDAVKRVVSATVVDDKVFLRGLGGRYSGVLLNGVQLPSPDPDEQGVPLDMFPTSLLSNLTVLKTYSPDLPGGFAGGALQIETTPYPTTFEAKLKLSGSGDSVSTFKDTFSHRGGALDFVGFDDGDRSLPSAVPDGGPVVPGPGLDDAQLERIGESFQNNWRRRAHTARPNFGLSATLGDTVSLGGRTAGYVATLGYGLKETVREGDVAKVRVLADGLEYREQLSSAQATQSADLSALLNTGIELSSTDQLSMLLLYTHSGDARTSTLSGYSDGDSQEIQTSRLQFRSRSLLFGQLQGSHDLGEFDLTWQANGSYTTRDEPDTRDVVHQVVEGGALRFKTGPGSGTRFFSTLEDLAGGGGVNLSRPFGASTVRVGATAQYSSRSFDARRFRYLFQGSDPLVLQLPIEQMLSPEHIGPDFRLQEETLQSDGYEASLAVIAGYGLADWAVTDALRLIGGVRYEVAVQDLTPGSDDAVNATPEPGLDRTDRDVLPSVNAVYAVRPDMNLRAGWSSTIARPQFRELAPFLYFDFDRRRSISGNPDLETTRIQNVDVRWEWFPTDEEVLAASVFYKRFTDPIEQAIVSAAQGDILYVNAPQADVIGIELEGRVALGRITPALDRLRLATNVSFIESEVDFGGAPGPQTNDSRELQGQSPYVVNVALTWLAPFGTELTGLYNVAGRRLVEVGFNQLPDTYEQPFHRVDLTLGRELAEGWKLKAAISNLLDQEVELKQEDLTVLRYRPGIAGSIALEWSR